MMKSADSIMVAKGKKFEAFNSPQESQDIILKQVIGPSGNLRAPTYRVKNQYIVGFNAEMYFDLFKA